MSVKSKHSSTKKEKIRKKEKRKKLEESEEDIDSSEEELDLTKECHPIGHYLGDRTEMINQMFSVIKGNKLKAMLPPILKDCDLDQLKLLCLDQLLGMSEKRITCILEGEILETSSESEIEMSEGESNDKNGTSSSSSSQKSDDDSADADAYQEKGSTTKRKKRKVDAVHDTAQVAAAPPEQGKTLLEILELEMRARAIRALLKQGGTDNVTDSESKAADTSQNGVKEVNDEIVDLTGCEEEEPPIKVKKEKLEEMEIDKKVSNFEDKIKKSQLSEKEKPNQAEDEKAKRLQAELELRNKLFKKKIYRTRQQRMENEEEDDSGKKIQLQNEEEPIQNVVVKQEPPEPEEIVVEDPEEGEVSTSEDEYPVEIKKEVIEPEVHDTPDTPECTFMNVETELVNGAQRISAMDNGTFVLNHDLENNENISLIESSQDGNQMEVLEDSLQGSEENKISLADGETVNIEKKTADCEEQEQGEKQTQTQEKDQKVDAFDSTGYEETSWRDRWLRNDGVQKLVKSSKICAKVKKKLRDADKSLRSKEGNSSPSGDMTSSTNKSALPLEVIEGSIEEYEKLQSKSISKPKEAEAVASPSNQEKYSCEVIQKSGEDSELLPTQEDSNIPSS